MKDITQDFGTLYHPTSALVIYQTDERNKDTYVEHFDMDSNGNPINAHTHKPLKSTSQSVPAYSKWPAEAQLANGGKVRK